MRKATKKYSKVVFDIGTFPLNKNIFIKFKPY